MGRYVEVFEIVHQNGRLQIVWYKKIIQKVNDRGRVVSATIDQYPLTINSKSVDYKDKYIGEDNQI